MSQSNVLKKWNSLEELGHDGEFKPEVNEIVCPVCDIGAPLEKTEDHESNWTYARGQKNYEVMVCSKTCKLLFENTN